MNTNELLELSEVQLEKMTKLCRKSWRVRVLRYQKLLPKELLDLDPTSPAFKTMLKVWVRKNIPKDGDIIFKGRIRLQNLKENDDWLFQELESWKQTEEQDWRCLKEMEDILYWN